MADIKYASIVFIQGEEAEEPLNILDIKGHIAVLDYLKQWDNGEYHELNNVSSKGSKDDFIKIDDYLISFNFGLGYIGLEKVIEEV